MSWSISAQGKREEVVKEVKSKEYVSYHGAHPEQETQFGIAKEGILGQIACMPDKVTNVKVQAGGHLDEVNANVNISVSSVRE